MANVTTPVPVHCNLVMQRSVFRVLVVGVVLAGCSRTGELREQADRAMPSEGPVGEARQAESAAIGATTIQATTGLPQPLTIDGTISWAVANNRDLRTQINAAERARLDITIARSTVYSPRLTATGTRTLSTTTSSGTRADNESVGKVALNTNLLGFTVAPYALGSWGEQDGVVDNRPYGSAVGIAVSRRIFALAEDTRLSAPLTTADRSYAKSVNALTLRTRRIALDAARAFFDLQRAQTRNKQRETRLEQARLFLTGVKESVAAGLKAPIEETNASIDLNQSEANLLSDQQAVANARDRLLSLLDQPLGTLVMITAKDVTDVKPDLPALQDDIGRVLAGHEDLVNLRIDIDQSNDDQRVARDRLAPQVTATATAGRTWNSERFGGTDEEADVIALGVTVDMPLDGWTGERAALHQQQRSSRDLRLRSRSSSSELERQVRELRRRIEVQVRSVELAQQRLVAEQAKFAATEASYRTGKVDNLELTRARETVDRAEVDLIDTRIELVLALAEREALLPPEPPR